MRRTNAVSYKAFSLIELLVVMAIVAILAGIAVPAYNRYILATKLNAAIPVVDGLIEQMITYANIHGYFPNPYDLGLSVTPNDPQKLVANPSALNQYFADVQFEDDRDTGSYPGCGASGRITITFNHTLLGQSANAYDTYTCKLWHYNGTINKLCSYTGYSGAPNYKSYLGLMPGVLDYYSDSHYGPYAFLDFYKNSTTITKATCIGTQ